MAIFSGICVIKAVHNVLAIDQQMFIDVEIRSDGGGVAGLRRRFVEVLAAYSHRMTLELGTQCAVIAFACSTAIPLRVF